MTSAWTASRVDLSEALAWRGRTTALASRVRRVPLASSRRVRETRCAAAPGGGARPIDPRLDAVVGALPIKEVLHRCLHELEVRAPRRSVLSRRHPSTASPKPMPYTPNRHARDAPRAQPRILPSPTPVSSDLLRARAPGTSRRGQDHHPTPRHAPFPPRVARRRYHPPLGTPPTRCARGGEPHGRHPRRTRR